MLERRRSIRSKIRAWTCYAAISYVAVSVTVVGLTLDQLAEMVGARDGVDLRQIFLGRGVGAVCGTVISGWMIDRFPLRQVIMLFIVSSAVLLSLVPFAPSATILVLSFFAVGLSGSALVVGATTSACWAFPGASVGPVMSATSAAFGISSALLPFVLRPFSGSLHLQYGISAACCLPALLLLWLGSAPVRPRVSSLQRAPAPRPESLERGAGGAHGAYGGRGSQLPDSADGRTLEGRCEAVGGGAAGGARGIAHHGSVCCRRSTALTLCAGLVQVLLQGGLSSLMGWIVSFGRTHWDEADSASALISALQGASTVGCIIAASFQKRLDLLVLLPLQLAIATIGMLACTRLASTSAAGFVAIGWYGLFAGPTVGYCSSLLNTYVTLTGFRMSIVSLGINAGANLVPWAVGCLMSSLGPLALVLSISVANAILVLAMGCAAVCTTIAQRRAGASHVEPLLGSAKAEREC